MYDTLDLLPRTESLQLAAKLRLRGAVVGDCRRHAGCSHKRTHGRKPRRKA